jgi:RIP metalloprotease RseP
MAVALAGIVTHFTMAFLLLVMLFAAIGVPNYDKPSQTIGTISKLPSGASPAQAAGFKVGDRVVAINGTPITNWEQILPVVRGSAGRTVDFVVDRNGTRLNLTATPTEVTQAGQTYGFIGVAAKPTVERMNPFAAVPRASSQIWHLSVGSVGALGSFFAPSSLRNYAGQLTNSTHKTTSTAADDQRFVSVVGVARIAGQAAESGAFNVVYLLVLLNIFIGVFNLVPLLPLDGGHVAIATYERIRSRAGRRYQADVGKMMPVAAAMIAILVVIGITSIYLDIVKPMANPFH